MTAALNQIRDESGKHTPGPWRLKFGPQHSPEHCDITVAGDIFLLADINGPNYSHCEANARLIGAAPELLAALKKASQLADIATDWNLDEVEIDGEMVRTYDLRDEFDAAIAKATGGSL